MGKRKSWKNLPVYFHLFFIIHISICLVGSVLLLSMWSLVLFPGWVKCYWVFVEYKLAPYYMTYIINILTHMFGLTRFGFISKLNHIKFWQDEQKNKQNFSVAQNIRSPILPFSKITESFSNFSIGNTSDISPLKRIRSHFRSYPLRTALSPHAPRLFTTWVTLYSWNIVLSLNTGRFSDTSFITCLFFLLFTLCL